MNNEQHYVYLIINKTVRNRIDKKYYIGVRTDNHIFIPDILTGRYNTSSQDKEFVKELKENRDNFYIKSLKFFDSRKLAEEFETILHKKYSVGSNSRFYNKATQTQDGFSNYGTTFTMSNVGIQNRKSSMLKNLGVEHSFQSPIVREKSKQTILEKYGVEYICQSEEVKQKYKNTCLEKYGVTNPGKLQQVSVIAYILIDNTKIIIGEYDGLKNATRQTGTSNLSKSVKNKSFAGVYNIKTKQWIRIKGDVRQELLEDCYKVYWSRK